jgi:tetratricopeptide (TPR) repeat protein
MSGFAQGSELDDAEALEQRAWAAHGARRWLEAAQRWEAFRDRFPDSPAGFALGSIALIELGRFYEADALLHVAMDRFPDVEEIHGDYALVAQHRRDWREAVARWEAFRAKFPLSVIGYSLGVSALVELERFADADVLILLGLEVAPQCEELLEKYAWIAQISGDLPEATRRWRKLKVVYPENQSASVHDRQFNL